MIKKTIFLGLFLSVLVLHAQKKPNFLVVLLDDVSPDLYSCYGQPAAANTPNVDKLAKKGVMFNTCYASAMCGPSRVEIMTGTYGATNGVFHNSMWTKNIGKNVYTKFQAFGKLLKDAGYSTAIAGKWHAGYQMPYEKEVGFDEYCLWEGMKEIRELPGKPKFDGILEDHKTTSRYWHPGIIKNHKLLKTKPTDFGPDIFAGFIMDFMERKAKAKEPFLAYWPSVAPHGTRTGCPTNPSRGKVGDMGGKHASAAENKARFKSLNEYIDGLMGKVVKKIEDLGIADNTIIIFTSDNGTAITAKTRGVERGCHVINIISGAGIKQRGATNELTDFTDIAPTLLDFAGVKLPKGKKFDGISLKPFLTGKKETTKPVIMGYIASSQVIRTKDHLLEAVNPFLGYPQGRFYATADQRFWKDYTKIKTEDRGKAFKPFQNFLDKYPPITEKHPVWKNNRAKKFLKQYTTKKSMIKHLYNHRDYKGYDDTYEE